MDSRAAKPYLCIPQNLIDELKQNLSGYVLQPGDPGFGPVIQIDNGRVNLQPQLVVMANGVEDVVTALRFAQTNQAKFTVIGGGHSAAGYCLNTGGMVLDLSLMNSIRLDARMGRVNVQMGARWNDVYVFLMQGGTGLIPIGGGCPTVGIPGFMQGGGYSFASRSYGLSIDNLHSLTIVTPDCEVRRISDASQSKEERDLFWACRGGGGGNFGIIVEMEIQAHRPRTPKMLMAQIRYDPAQAQDVLGFYNEWVEGVPNELAVYGIWGTQPDPADTSKIIKTFGFTAVYNGDFPEGLALVEPLLKRRPILALLNSFTLPEFEEVNGRTTLVGRRSAYIRSGMMAPGSMQPKAVEILEHYMNSAPSPSSFMVWTHAGGAIGNVAADATPFYHRSARFVPEIKSIWDRPQDARANIEWAYSFYKDLGEFFTGAYVNYIDPLLPEWAKQYYGGNYERLLRVKQHWDPGRFFHFQQGIGSTFEPKTTMPLDLSPLNRTIIDE
jgi:hypothetical protein